MGFLEYPGRYEKLNGGEALPPDEYSEYADSIFWGAIFYGVCFVLCTLRYLCDYVEQKDKARQVLSV
jgi:cytochrome c oxidase subunit IV